MIFSLILNTQFDVFAYQFLMTAQILAYHQLPRVVLARIDRFRPRLSHRTSFPRVRCRHSLWINAEDRWRAHCLQSWIRACNWRQTFVHEHCPCFWFKLFDLVKTWANVSFCSTRINRHSDPFTVTRKTSTQLTNDTVAKTCFDVNCDRLWRSSISFVIDSKQRDALETLFQYIEIQTARSKTWTTTDKRSSRKNIYQCKQWFVIKIKYLIRRKQLSVRCFRETLKIH